MTYSSSSLYEQDTSSSLEIFLAWSASNLKMVTDSDKAFDALIAYLKVVDADVASTWMAFGGNTRDLGSFGEETDKTTTKKKKKIESVTYQISYLLISSLYYRPQKKLSEQLLDCYGYERIDITSKSVKHFQFYGYMCPWQDLPADRIEINAPYIVSLIVDGHLYLWKLLLLDVSSLVKAHLDYIKNRYDEATLKEGNEDMLKASIQSLGHVKELKIGTACLSALSWLEAKGFISSSNLKVVDHISPISSYSDSDRDSNESGDSDGDSEEL
ncbi:hypothetical protein Tco_1254899 [Tanacetum coccineum]